MTKSFIILFFYKLKLQSVMIWPLHIHYGQGTSTIHVKATVNRHFH